MPVFIIYRKSDRSVVGRAHPPMTPEQEVQNIVNSELGGTADDYGHVELQELQPGTPVVNENLTVSFTPPAPPRDFAAELEASRGNLSTVIDVLKDYVAR